MARPLRIQFPDAWYHVMNRGKRGAGRLSKQDIGNQFYNGIEQPTMYERLCCHYDGLQYVVALYIENTSQQAFHWQTPQYKVVAKFQSCNTKDQSFALPAS
jgi:hypothetical protein